MMVWESSSEGPKNSGIQVGLQDVGTSRWEHQLLVKPRGKKARDRPPFADIFDAILR